MPEHSWSHNYSHNCHQRVAEDYAAGADELLNRSYFPINCISKEEGQEVKQGSNMERGTAAPELKCLLLVLSSWLQCCKWSSELELTLQSHKRTLIRVPL